MDKCRKCRKFGTKLFLKGSRCTSPNCSFTRRNYRPGAHGSKKTSPRKSEYGLQLIEKQKAKAEYGLREKQFVRFFQKASKSKVATGEELISLLELRFDNVVYRLGLAQSRAQARQIIAHRKLKLNERIVNIPSVILKPKDKISPINKEVVKPVKTTIPKWLKLDPKTLSGEVLRKPLRSEIETDIDEQLVIEFYSR